MRLLLRYRTDDGQHPDGDITHQQVLKILRGLGWMPRENGFATTKLTEVLDMLPEPIRRQVTAGEPILIAPRPGLWGIVSSENEHQLFIRLVDHDLATLRSAADMVVDTFPPAFSRETGRDPEFDPEVAIRRFDSEVRIVVGEIEEKHTTGFWRYARKQRRREYLAGLLLSLMMVAVVVGSLAIFFFAHGTDDYWRGYLDRVGTAFLTAALTIFINIVFEFRHWRNDKRRINWEDHVRPGS